MIHTLGNVDKQVLLEIASEKQIRKTSELFLLFSLGSQFDHLIKQAVDRLGVFCLVADPNKITAEDVRKIKPKGIIVSGGPASVYEGTLSFDCKIFDLGIPVMGICLGFQLWAQHIGCSVEKSPKREFGTHHLSIFENTILFSGCHSGCNVLMSHGDNVLKTTNSKIRVLAYTDNCPIAAGNYKHLWGVQFHPEVTETTIGPQIFWSFCFLICKAKNKYPAKDVAREKILSLRETIGNKNVLLALSGGSDSSTVAYLLRDALIHGQYETTDQLRGVYIRGIDRPDDEDHVRKYFDWIDLKIVDATDRFLKALRGKKTMPEKRLAMRGVYKAVLEKEAIEFGANFIAQGTLFTDISESGGGYEGEKKAQIKLHHNVELGFSFPELTPLDDCVKDTGRSIGREIGVPEDLLVRQPFPGPGLIVRIEGEITGDKLKIARQVDDIYIHELRNAGLYEGVWQAGAVITQSVTTCTKGDGAASGIVVALWAVWSVNGFTAQAAELPWDFIKLVSQRITNNVPEVGAVVYRTSDKPPATIEWG